MSFVFSHAFPVACHLSRWTFSNEAQCFLTRWQAIELKWHFMAEQLSGSHLMGFFGFNGEKA